MPTSCRCGSHCPYRNSRRRRSRRPRADLESNSPGVEESMTQFRLWPAFLLWCLFFVGPLQAQQTDLTLREEVLRALKKAATFYHDRAASHGGYVYYYSTDLKERWGEGKATAVTIFVQPPGTPTVGMAYLRA